MVKYIINIINIYIYIYIYIYQLQIARGCYNRSKLSLLFNPIVVEVYEQFIEGFIINIYIYIYIYIYTYLFIL